MSAHIPNIEDFEKGPELLDYGRRIEAGVREYPFMQTEGTAYSLNTPKGYEFDVTFHTEGFMSLRTSGVHTPFGGAAEELFLEPTTNKVLDIRLTALQVNFNALPSSEQNYLQKLMMDDAAQISSHPNKEQAKQELFRLGALKSIRQTLSVEADCGDYSFTSAFNFLDRSRFMLHLNSYTLYEDDLLSPKYSPERVGKGIYLGDATEKQLGLVAVRFIWEEGSGGEIREFGTAKSPDGYLVPTA